MTWLHKIIQLLKRPFPDNEPGAVYYRNLALIGLFVALFLLTFQPFGFQNTVYIKLMVALGYGAVTFLAGALFHLSLGMLFRKYIVRQQLTLWKWLLEKIGIILIISIANFFFVSFLSGNLVLRWLPRMVLITCAIGIFPVTILGTLSMLRQERKHQGIAQEINEKQVQVAAKEEAFTQLIFGIPIAQIRYVEALQNYAKIVYFDGQTSLKEQVERTTLKNILAEVGEYPIVRCHRSFLVNKDAILSFSGNAQGLLLALADTEQTIPVSRSFVSVFRS